jgi:hypothetical protein
MALTERKEIGSMEVLPMGQIQVRTDTVIERDGVEISRTYHRHVVEPSVNEGDLAKQNTRVQALVEAVHTPEIKTAWEEFIKLQRENI